MSYLIFILISVALLGGFCVLTWQERKRGVRLLAPHRAAFDKHMTRMRFVVMHVDFAAFLREEALQIFRAVSRIIAQFALRVVRVVERLLMRIVHRLHLHHAAPPPRAHKETREFVKTLSDFKGRLKETVPEMVTIHD